MPIKSLFEMPTPDEVRMNAREGLFRQAQQAAMMPQGRGFVQAASNAGGLFGEALARGMGGKLPGEDEAQKFQMVQAQVMKDIDQLQIDPTQPEGFLALTRLTAQYANQVGLPDVAQKAALQGLEIRKSIQKEAGDMFAPIYNDLGQVVAQRNLKDNRVYPDPRAPKDPDTVINNNLGDQDALKKKLAEELGKDIVQRRKDATDAKHSLMSANNAIKLLNSGVITGTGANFIVGAGKALQRIGFNVGKDEVSNTEAFYANQAKQVAQIIKAFGAGTGLSDADREYAERAAAGKITMSEESIKKIIALNATASRNVISEFNADIGNLPEGTTPFPLSIEIPEMLEFSVPTTDQTKPASQGWSIRKK